MTLQIWLRIIYMTSLVVTFGYEFIASFDLLPIARNLPIFVTTTGLLLAVTSISVDVITFRRTGSVAFGGHFDLMPSTIGENAASALVDQEGESETLRHDSLLPAEDEESARADPAVLKRSLILFAWILAYIVAIAVFGLILASIAFLLLFLRTQARLSPLRNVILVVAVTAFLFLTQNLLNLEWPDSIFGEMVGL